MIAVDVDDTALATYRYLRLAIVLAVLMLFVSLAVEFVTAGCLKGSISGYFYSPVRSVFVGVLMAIGLALIALRGRPDREEFWLNLAGMFAPMIGLVPTTPSTDCTVSDTAPDVLTSTETTPLPQWVVAGVRNNMVAYVAVGVVAVALTLWWPKIAPLLRLPTPPARDPMRSAQLKAAGRWYAAIVVGAGLAFWLSDDFRRVAHYVAAVAMFVCFWRVVHLNRTRRGVSDGYRRWYDAMFWLMVGGAVLIGGFKALDDWKPRWDVWDEEVFWLEVVEIAAFAGFWAAQTLERWSREPLASGTMPAEPAG